MTQEFYLPDDEGPGKYCRHIDKEYIAFGRGVANNFYFRFVDMHMAKQHAAHGKAIRFARGFGDMLSEKFFKNGAI